MQKTIWLLVFLLAVPVFAETDTADVHFAAHFGTSFAIQTVVYGFSKRAFHMDTVDALFFASVITFVGTTMRQVVSAGNEPINGTGVLQNTAGIAASIGTCLMFNL